jgi:hypothetical protein
VAAWTAMSAVSPSPGGRAAPRRAGAPARRPPLPARTGDLPPPRSQVRRNRTWMTLLLLTPVILAGLAVLAFATDGGGGPSVKPRSVPAGYDAITDSYFGYVVPKSYQQNTTWTDQNADFFYGEAPAFVAETLLITKMSPTPSSHPPASFGSFGQLKSPVPYTVSDGHAVRIPGTAFAYEESITRPGGYHALALDAWERDSSTQVWLLIRAPARVTSTVVASLQG